MTAPGARRHPFAEGLGIVLVQARAQCGHLRAQGTNLAPRLLEFAPLALLNLLVRLVLGPQHLHFAQSCCVALASPLPPSPLKIRRATATKIRATRKNSAGSSGYGIVKTDQDMSAGRANCTRLLPAAALIITGDRDGDQRPRDRSRALEGAFPRPVRAGRRPGRDPQGSLRADRAVEREEVRVAV